MLPATRTASMTYNELAILISQFVTVISLLDQPLTYNDPTLARYISRIEQMLAFYDVATEYDYSPSLQLFQQAVHEVGLERSPLGIVSYDEDCDQYRDTDDTITILIKTLWARRSRRWR